MTFDIYIYIYETVIYTDNNRDLSIHTIQSDVTLLIVSLCVSCHKTVI